jgi:hypothetical protein
MTPNSITLIRLQIFSEYYKANSLPYRGTPTNPDNVSSLDDDARGVIEERVRERVRVIRERGGVVFYENETQEGGTIGGCSGPEV